MIKVDLNINLNRIDTTVNDKHTRFTILAATELRNKLSAAIGQHNHIQNNLKERTS